MNLGCLDDMAQVPTIEIGNTWPKNCPEELSCFDLDNTKKLIRWIKSTKRWIKQAKIACSTERKRGK